MVVCNLLHFLFKRREQRCSKADHQISPEEFREIYDTIRKPITSNKCSSDISGKKWSSSQADLPTPEHSSRGSGPETTSNRKLKPSNLSSVDHLDLQNLSLPSVIPCPANSQRTRRIPPPPPLRHSILTTALPITAATALLNNNFDVGDTSAIFYSPSRSHAAKVSNAKIRKSKKLTNSNSNYKLKHAHIIAEKAIDELFCPSNASVCGDTQSVSLPRTRAPSVCSTVKSFNSFMSCPVKPTPFILPFPTNLTKLTSKTSYAPSSHSNYSSNPYSSNGRHSPAHSELSKTESALSPPSDKYSDLSKTESNRNLNQIATLADEKKKNNQFLLPTIMSNIKEIKQPVQARIINQKRHVKTAAIVHLSDDKVINVRNIARICNNVIKAVLN